MRKFRAAWLVIPVFVAAVGLTGCGDPNSSTLARPYDPVVLKGSDVSALTGAAPGDLVGFRHDSTGWVQIPVQVDERAVINVGTTYHSSANSVTFPSYTDAGTWAGADPNPAFDADDEIAFMAADAGGEPASFSEPAGVVAGSGVDVRLADPLDSGGTQVGHVFLYRRTAAGGLQPGAGKSYVNYSFSLASGDYKTTYGFATGPNPENSTISTPYYKVHFADRWLNDEIHITSGSSSGIDIIDRNKVLFAPGVCGRSESTFDAAEGAFIVNKNGPVRAIRGYVGANSGPNTQREHIFYQRREDITTSLRVHAIPSIMDLYDYSVAASGSTYSNNLNPNGVTVDGVPDTVATGALTWEKFDGAGGTLLQSESGVSSQGIVSGSYYEDNKTNPTTQCSGDAFSYGVSGSYTNQAINCTDPATGCTDSLVARRVLHMLPPNIPTAGAQIADAWDRNPLTHTTTAWTG
jgi:hypothetical protein